jgi:hypothetical protein
VVIFSHFIVIYVFNLKIQYVKNRFLYNRFNKNNSKGINLSREKSNNLSTEALQSLESKFWLYRRIQ